MSIYPVRLSHWFPLSDEMHEIAKAVVELNKCDACGSKVRWKAAWGHHSLPWGEGTLWCGVRCMNSGKVFKMDKRQLRKLKKLLCKS